jgi:hypothetical protein
MNNTQNISAIDHLLPVSAPNQQNCLLSWNAIFISALASVGFSFLLNLFSIAIGLTAFKTTPEGAATTLATGGFIGILIGIIASMFFSGWLAGYLARPAYTNRINLGSLHGFVAWCLALLITITTFTYVGQFVTEYLSFISHPEIIQLSTSMSKTASLSLSSPSVNQALMPKNSLNDLGLKALIIFSIFFLSALVSSIGGHCGGASGNKKAGLIQ